MLRRTFALMVAVALVTWAVPASAADALVAEGKVSKLEAGKVTITDKDGKAHPFVVPGTAKLTLDGKACKLEDLKVGTPVKVTTEKKGDADVVVSVEGKAG